LGDREVQIAQVGRAHTKGDTVVWLSDEKVMFSGDIVEYHSALYCGDAYLTDSNATMDAVKAYRPNKIVPGRGAALDTPQKISDAFKGTAAFVDALFGGAKECVAAGKDLKQTCRHVYDAMKPEFGDWVIFDHFMPFNVTRAFDEASGITDPQIWTAERDAEMWATLEG
jgi:glyoxylase-like metal-dependent hydrolase (beta-lactamase superfamily II)